MNTYKLQKTHFLVFIISLIFGLSTGSAAASLVILSNDSSITASVSASVYDDTYSYIYSSDSDSASQTFTGSTSVPGSFMGSVADLAAYAPGESGYAAEVSTSQGELSATISDTGSGETVVSANLYGTTASGFLYPDTIDSATANLTSKLDIVFSLTTAYDYWSSIEANGFGQSGGYFRITNLDTNTVENYLSGLCCGVTAGPSGSLTPGMYRLENAGYANAFLPFGGGFGHYSHLFETTFTEAASSVPVPPAAWLFISGIVPLLSFARKTNTGKGNQGGLTKGDRFIL